MQPVFKNPSDFIGQGADVLVGYLDGADQSAVLSQWKAESESRTPMSMRGTATGTTLLPDFEPATDAPRRDLRGTVCSAPAAGTMASVDSDPQPKSEPICPSLLSTHALSSIYARGMEDRADIPIDHAPITIPNIEIVRFLGGGAFGSVFMGRVRSSGLVVAVKVLKKQTDVDLPLAAANEAVNAAKINHPNVMRVFDLRPVGELWVIVLEFVRGDPMTSYLAPAMVSKVFRRLADAVHHLHSRGILHRDLKPGNIVLRFGTWEPVIVDLGLSLDLNLYDPEEVVVGGTPYFMPAEVLAGGVDPTHDAYSLGVTAATILLGRPLPGAPHDTTQLTEFKREGKFEPALLAAVRSQRSRHSDSFFMRLCRYLSPPPVNAAWISRLIGNDAELRIAALSEALKWRV